MKLEINLREVMELYKEELAAKNEECMLRKVIQAQLEAEIVRLNKKIEAMNNEAEDEKECMEN